MFDVTATWSGFPSESAAHDFATFLGMLLAPWAAAHTPGTPKIEVGYGSLHDEDAPGAEPRIERA